MNIFFFYFISALSHGKWLVKPENWPKEIDFIDPNNGAVIGGMYKPGYRTMISQHFSVTNVNIILL